MSNISIYAKTKFILKMIGNIKKIITKHGGIIKALEDELEAKGSYDVWNFIAHDYERVRLEIVEDILRNSLEGLEEKILKLSADFELWLESILKMKKRF